LLMEWLLPRSCSVQLFLSHHERPYGVLSVKFFT
jgi:hypothetical protein